MVNNLKKAAANLKEVAGTAKKIAVSSSPTENETTIKSSDKKSKDTVLIGGHFPRAVRRSIAQLQADPRNDGKKINDLLAEALNDLFAKYNVPQTANLGKSSD